MKRLVRSKFLSWKLWRIQVFCALVLLLYRLIIGKWHINRLFKIQPSKDTDDSNIGELYLQIRFTKKGDKPEPGEPEMLYDLMKELDQEVLPVDGQLLINIPHAKNLIANDKTTSDPFCKIYVPGGVKLETPYIKKTLTPVWKYKTTAKIHVPKNVKF